MNKTNRIAAFVIASILLSSSFAIRQVHSREFVKEVQDFFVRETQTLAPTNIAARSITSYHIGNFPHFSFGVGIAAGTKFNTLIEGSKDWEKYKKKIEEDKFVFSSFPGIGAAALANVRIGGANIPFDFGVSFMYLPVKYNDTKYKSTLIGFDFRFALLEEQVKVPGISLGLSYTYQNTTFAARNAQTEFYGTTESGAQIIVNIEAGEGTTSVDTHVISMPIQISRLLGGFFEPMLGVEPFFVIGKSSYSVDADVSVNQNGVISPLADVREGISYNSDLFNKDHQLEINHTHYDGGVRLYTGFSFAIARIWYLDFKYFYEPVRSVIGASFNTRFTF